MEGGERSHEIDWKVVGYITDQEGFHDELDERTNNAMQYKCGRRLFVPDPECTSGLSISTEVYIGGVRLLEVPHHLHPICYVCKIPSPK